MSPNLLSYTLTDQYLVVWTEEGATVKVYMLYCESADDAE